MKERPIIFSAPMVRALLSGSKTQTRRVFKQAHGLSLSVGIPDETPGVAELSWLYGDGPGYDVHESIKRVPCPYGQPGDRLWVREAWRTYASIDDIPPRGIAPGAGVQYEAGGSNVAGANRLHGIGKLRPGMFMPRWAGRITLEITGVRVERLQDISPDDCIAEGVWSIANSELGRGEEAISAYRKLWESIHGQGSFDPRWVWVIEFKAVTP